MHVNPRTISSLEGAPLGRALRHARECARCRTPVERTMLALRMLEHGSTRQPTQAEMRAAEEQARVVVGAASSDRPRWPILMGVGATLAAAAAVPFLLRTAEFTERGAGEGRAVLRTFCAEPLHGQVRELPSGAPCRAGEKLAFAASSASGLSSVMVQVVDAAGPRVFGPFPVSGRPGAEAPLEVTPELRTPGQLEVSAAFASTPEAAVAALHGKGVPGTVLLHQSLLVESSR